MVDFAIESGNAKVVKTKANAGHTKSMNRKKRRDIQIRENNKILSNNNKQRYQKKIRKKFKNDDRDDFLIDLQNMYPLYS